MIAFDLRTRCCGMRFARLKNLPPRPPFRSSGIEKATQPKGRHAGLVSAPFITVDDTGARHARRDGVTTQIGSDRFTVFRTGWSKSRLNFLSLLRAGHEDYVINDAALGHMRGLQVDPSLIEKLSAYPEKMFGSQSVWLEHLARLSIDIFDKTLLRALSEGAIWGAIRHHGLMSSTVVVSNGARQFRIANHALC